MINYQHIMNCYNLSYVAIFIGSTNADNYFVILHIDLEQGFPEEKFGDSKGNQTY